MGRRLIERVLALSLLVAALPLLMISALAIRVTSEGPIIYRARRVGQGGREFDMFKLRTMRVSERIDERVSSARDPRIVSPFSAWLRACKIDELPQLVNVLRGEMAIVGPRPEDPEIVRRFYRSQDLELLLVLPGITSPASIYSSTHGERMLPAEGTELCYVKRVLPAMLALDHHYFRHRSLGYDLRILGRTIGLIASKALRRRVYPEPPELPEALAQAYVLSAQSACGHEHAEGFDRSVAFTRRRGGSA